MGFEFVPDACSAITIQACIAAKVGLLTGNSPVALEATVDGIDGNNIALRASLDTNSSCLADAIGTAFEAATIVIPPIPPPPPVPDLSGCRTALQPLKEAETDPLAFLAGIIEIEFDESGRPTKIKVP